MKLHRALPLKNISSLLKTNALALQSCLIIHQDHGLSLASALFFLHSSHYPVAHNIQKPIELCFECTQ